MSKASEGDRISAQLFKILKAGAVKALHPIHQQIWKTYQWPQDWKSQILFQSQRRAIPNNVQTVVQLCSLHMLARLCSQSFKQAYSSTWAEKFQMWKPGFEDTEELEFKLPTFVGSWRKQGNFRKIELSTSPTTQPLTVWNTKNCGKLLEMGVPDHLTCLLRNLYVGQEETVWTGHVETYWFDVILLSHKKEWGCTIFSNMEGPRNYHTKWSKSEREIKIAYDITHMGNLKYNTNEQIYETSYELWCWRRLESPLDCKEIQPVHPKGNQSSILFARTNDEAETPILWPPDVKNWLIWKDPDTGKDWRREEKGTTADEMVGWHHQLSRHETE